MSAAGHHFRPTVPLSLLLLALFALTVLSAGCSGTKPVLERGWAGVRFVDLAHRFHRETGNPAGALLDSMHAPEPPGLPEGPYVAVRQVIHGSPAAAVGLQEGDLVLTIDEDVVDDAGDLNERIRSAAPGDELALEIYRRGERSNHVLRVGCERYQRFGSLNLGLSLAPKLTLLPPDVNLLGLLRWRISGGDVELHDPVRRAATWQQQPSPAAHSPEGWFFWLLVFGVGRHIEVLSQEPVSG